MLLLCWLRAKWESELCRFPVASPKSSRQFLFKWSLNFGVFIAIVCLSSIRTIQRVLFHPGSALDGVSGAAAPGAKLRGHQNELHFAWRKSQREVHQVVSWAALEALLRTRSLTMVTEGGEGKKANHKWRPPPPTVAWPPPFSHTSRPRLETKWQLQEAGAA